MVAPKAIVIVSNIPITAENGQIALTSFPRVASDIFDEQQDCQQQISRQNEPILNIPQEYFQREKVLIILKCIHFLCRRHFHVPAH